MEPLRKVYFFKEKEHLCVGQGKFESREISCHSKQNRWLIRSENISSLNLKKKKIQGRFKCD